MRVIILSLVLVGCGPTEDTETSSAAPATLTASFTTTLRGFTEIPNTTIDCVAHRCTASFQAGDENCGLTTVALLEVSEGIAYVQKIDGIFIRQNQPHQFTFDAMPAQYDAQGFADGVKLLMYCHGPG